MEPIAPRVTPGSWLHRVLGLKPGYVPWWLCSRDYCLGFDLFVPLHISMLAGALLAPKLFGISWLWIPGILLLVSFVVLVYVPFEDRERWGRARRRRGECVWCGQLEVESGNVCSACQQIT